MADSILIRNARADEAAGLLALMRRTFGRSRAAAAGSRNV